MGLLGWTAMPRADAVESVELTLLQTPMTTDPDAFYADRTFATLALFATLAILAARRATGARR